MESYKYTHKESNLSKDQKQFYEKNGYLLIKNNVSEALMNEVCQRFLDICDNKSTTAAMTVMKDYSLKDKGVQGQYLIQKLQDFVYDDEFWKYCCDKDVVDIVEGIIGPNITAVHSMFINKPPNSDPGASFHPLHQDLYYFPFRPPERIAASWTALERVDERNGCLYVVPGTHNLPLYEHTYPQGFKNVFYHGIQDRRLNSLPKVNVIMERGDTVFFHPLLLHGSGPNTTKGFRKAISCHYADSNSYFIDVRGTVQQPIADEVKTVYGKRGVSLSYKDLWKAKSRLVRGQPGSFQKFDSHL